MQPFLTRLTRLGAIGAVAVTMAACVAPPPPPRPVPVVVAPPPPRPPNTGAPRPMTGLTLFSAPGFGGRPVMLDHAVPDLAAAGLGPVASVQVTGQPWQLCSRPGFGGHCIVVKHAARSLAKFGLAGRIASVRRVP